MWRKYEPFVENLYKEHGDGSHASEAWEPSPCLTITMAEINGLLDGIEDPIAMLNSILGKWNKKLQKVRMR